ncbi:MAG: S1C family serine protease [Candidatus Kuenenbacteria bacterium]
MSKQFTSKPIRNRQKPVQDKELAQEEINEFYEETENLPEIQKPSYHRGIWILVILISILFGFASSMTYNFLFTPRIGALGSQKVIVEKQEDVTVTSEERLHELVTRINPVVVNFYDNSKEVDGPFYQDIYSFGTGFILTSDGWIVTAKEIMDRIGDKDYLILTADYKIYTAQKILFDPVSQTVFVKIKANNLPVVKLGDMADLSSGQKIFGFIASYPQSRLASLHLADLQSAALEDVVASSDEFGHFLSAREGYDPSLIGSPIVNLAGEIVAVVIDTASAMPVSYLNTAIDDLAKKEKIYRPSLGVHYINLAKYPRVDSSAEEMRSKGALLTGYKSLTAVVKGSSADKAGLKVGDIITMVEDELVNGRKTLTQIIQDYNPGQKLKLTVLRGNTEKLFEIELGVVD